MIKAVVFDCFGVFYVDPVLAYQNDPQSDPVVGRALNALSRLSDRGEITKNDYEGQVAGLLRRPLQEIDTQFFHSQSRNQALLDFSQSLRARYKVGLLSNIGTDMMDGFFSLADRQQFFDKVVLSGSVHAAKPDPKIYLVACRQLDIEPHEAVMVDDSNDNCAAARKLGMTAVRYENFSQAKQDLSQLLA